MIPLAPWVRSLVRVSHPDEDVQRRGRNVIALAAGLILLTVPTLLVALTRPDGLISLIAAGIIVVGLGVIALLARRGHVTVAAVAMVVLIDAGLLAASLAGGRIGAVPFFFLVCVLIAAITLSPRMVAATVALVLASLVLLWLLVNQRPQDQLSIGEALGYGMSLCLVTGMIGALGARTARRALELVRTARSSAEQQAAALDRANADLEDQKQALQQALDAQAAQAVALQTALEHQRQLNSLVAQLALPVIPVRQDVLVIPVVGSLDSGRAGVLQRRVPGEVEHRRARAVLLDITGVTLVDSHVARALIDTAAAVRLLGARTLLVGIRPEVAQALVGLEVDLGLLEPYATLQLGLEAL